MQSIVLDCTIYDQYTGEPRSNFPKFEFNGDSGLAEIAKVAVGDIVVVSFVLKGRFYTNRAGDEAHVTNARGYKLEMVEQKNTPAQVSPVAPIPAPNTSTPAHGDSLPPMPIREPDFAPVPATAEDAYDLPF